MRKSYKLNDTKNVKKLKQSNKKLNIEIFEIIPNISIVIVKLRMNKAQKNLLGNYIYLIENNSHYSVDVKFDFNESLSIQFNDLITNKIIRDTIEPFTISPNYIKGDSQEYNSKSKVADLLYLNNYYVKCKIQLEIKFPTANFQYAILEKNESHNSYCNDSKLELINKYFKMFDFSFTLKNNYNYIKETLYKYNITGYVDFEFYPYNFQEMYISTNPYNPYYNSVTEIGVNELKDYLKIVIHWRPLNEIILFKKNNNILELEINPGDITYKFRCNYNYISVISHLAEYPNLIRRLLTPDSFVNNFNIYSVKLYLNGTLKDVVVDGLIPCFTNLQPLYTYSNSGKYTWAILIEKALAKVFKSYDKIRNKSVKLLYKMLTGYSLITLNLKSLDENKEVLYNKLENLFYQKYLISVSHNPEFDTNILNKEDYEVLCKLFDNKFSYPLLYLYKHNNMKLFAIRNILTDHGLNLYKTNLEYYAEINNIMSDTNKANLCSIIKNLSEKSTILLTDKEFFSYFNHYNILPIKNLSDLIIRGRFTRVLDINDADYECFISAFYYLIEVNEIMLLDINLHLKDEEFFQSRYDSLKGGFDLSIVILQCRKNDNYEIQYAHFFETGDNLSCVISLTPGRYILIPRTTGVNLKKHKDANKHVINFFTDDKKTELNIELLEYIFEDIFLINDVYAKNYLNFNQLKSIFKKLSPCKIDDLELGLFNTIIKNNCIGCNGITYKAFREIMIDILQQQSEQVLKEVLLNFGYDKNMYPFLNKFYYLKIGCAKQVNIITKSNLETNYDQIVNNLMLKHKADSEKLKFHSECTSISIKQNNIYIEGVKNHNKKEDKLVTLDFSLSNGSWVSLGLNVITKLVPAGESVFFCYLVNVEKETNREFRRCVNIEIANVTQNDYNTNNLGKIVDDKGVKFDKLDLSNL